MRKVSEAQLLGGYRVAVTFVDGLKKQVDLRPYLRGPIFEPMLRDENVFASFTVDRELGTIVWPNGADIDPDVLAGDYEPAWHTGEDRGAGA
jgi:hypothetical protein